jgi:hypothetical protein
MPQHHTLSPDNLQKKNAGNQHHGFIKTEKKSIAKETQSAMSNIAPTSPTLAMKPSMFSTKSE